MAKVAFIGLGVMGYPMAGHLKVKGGHDVTVYNRTAAKADKWVAQYGGTRAATPQEAAQGLAMAKVSETPINCKKPSRYGLVSRPFFATMSQK